MTRPLDDDDLPGRGYSGQRSIPDHGDREISLGTPTILGIFFALALLCACFFGFGYTMGRKSAQATSVAIPSSEGLVVAGSSAPKPAAGSTGAQFAASAPQPAATAPAPATETATVPMTPPTPSNSGVSPSDRIIAGDKLPAPAAPPATSNQPATSWVVQVAAVSTQDLADTEVSALQKLGFDVVVRHEPQDKLLHVQIGPFTDRKEAVAMQQRVIARGFNAIVK